MIKLNVNGLRAVIDDVRKAKRRKAGHQSRRRGNLKNWVDVVTEFESMARRVKVMAKDRDDVELEDLSERLLQRAANIRQDCYEYQCSSPGAVT